MVTPANPQRRSEKSHRAILDAALALCTELGYGKVTVEAIAARAGVSKKTIYRWWPSRGAVILETVLEGVQAVTEFPDTGDVAADLRTQITGVADFMTGPRAEAYTGLIAESHHDVQLRRALVDQVLEPARAAAAARLRRAVQQGALAADADLSMAIDLLYGPIYYRTLLHLEPFTHEQITALIDHVLATFAPPQP